MPHPGKVTQPGSRSALGHQQTGPSTVPNRDGGSNASTGPSSKPVWGNVKPSPVTVSRPEVTSNDFPTAAEVAQGKNYGNVVFLDAIICVFKLPPLHVRANLPNSLQKKLARLRRP